MSAPATQRLLTPLRHSPAPGDHIDQYAQERHNDQENYPYGLPPATQIPIAEQIHKDLEQHDQIAAENKGPQQQPEEVRETVHSNLRPGCSPEYGAVYSLGTSLSKGESSCRSRENP